MKTAVITTSSILAYILAGFLTYGYAVVRRDTNSVDAAFIGVFWPFYWIGRGVSGVADASENLFKEAPPPKVER